MKSRFDETAKRYMEQFGQPYAILMCDQRSVEEHIALMETAMKKGEPVPDPDPDWDDDFII